MRLSSWRPGAGAGIARPRAICRAGRTGACRMSTRSRTAQARSIGLLSIETSLIQLERHRQRHASFRRAIEWLKAMCLRGELATRAGLSPFGEWDGVLLVDAPAPHHLPERHRQQPVSPAGLHGGPARPAALLPATPATTRWLRSRPSRPGSPLEREVQERLAHLDPQGAAGVAAADAARAGCKAGCHRPCGPAATSAAC